MVQATPYRLLRWMPLGACKVFPPLPLQPNAGGATFTGTLDGSNITSGTLSSNLFPLTDVSAGTYGSSTQNTRADD